MRNTPMRPMAATAQRNRSPSHIRPAKRIGWGKQGGECCILKGNMEERAERLAQYIIENQATVRAAAVKFGISKSTVHMVVIN